MLERTSAKRLISEICLENLSPRLQTVIYYEKFISFETTVFFYLYFGLISNKYV